ncbi:MAG: hypothetical protein H6Q89_2140 [Myxococcaceae bacterium]|nr:hypothetical protein [Myxococcaceae bacterium]
MISAVYQRVMGHPFVYEVVRPFVVGGVDNSPVWRVLDVGPDDVVVDVGCGTGDALNHLTQFRSFHGFDTDPIALRAAHKRAAGRERVHFEERRLEAADLERLRPARVMLSGLLHHLSDSDVLDLLSMLAKSPGLKRVATVDPTYVRGHHLSNLFARLDRGKYPRKPEGYIALAERAKFRVVHHSLIKSHPKRGRSTFAMMGLEPLTA